MRRISSRLTVLLFFFLIQTQIQFAQDLDTVSVSGKIRDQNGALVPGAVVEVTNTSNKHNRTVVSDALGLYRLIQLEPGSYLIRVTANGFAPHEIPEIAALSGQNLTLDFVLTLSTVTAESVIIDTSQTPVIDTKRTVVGSTISMKDAELVPLATRSVLDLVLTLPGVTEEPLSTRDLAEDRNSNSNQTPEEAGTFALAGAPAYSNNLTIDGLDNNDDRAARERFQPPLEAVEEIQVITNQFSAEYGRASGGRVNLRTRSGSSDFRGRVFYFFRDESLNANTHNNNSLGLSRLPLQEHVGGFTFSGPLKPLSNERRPVTFFVALENTRVIDSSLIDSLVPVEQNKVFPLPQPTTLVGRRLEDSSPPALAGEIAPFIAPVSTPLKSKNLTVRVDQQLRQTHSVSLVYQSGRLRNLRQFGGGNRLADALQGRTRNSDAFSVSDTWVFSDRFINQLRAQYSRLAPGFLASTSNTPVVLIALNDPLSSEDLARRTGTLVAGSSTSGSSDRHEVRWQLQNVSSVIAGNHSLKFGTDYHYVLSEFIDLTDVTGTFNFASAGDFLASIPSRFRQNFQTTSRQTNTYLSFFAQDEWQLLPQLLLSYGIRYERESIINDLNNFGPRLSLAYDPAASGKLVIRFGAGIFYNRALLRTIDDFTLGQQQFFFDTNSLRDPLTGKLMTAEQRRTFIAANINFPQTLRVDSSLVKEFGSLNSQFSRRLDAKLRISESYQVNLGAERDLGRGYSVEANLSFTRGIHLWREFNVNAPRLPVGYSNFSSYLLSRDFQNFRGQTLLTRPLYNASTAGELVRFVSDNSARTNPNAISRVVEFGVPVSVFSLNSGTSTTVIDAALAAINDLRPDPSQAEIEQLISAGNSFYRGLTLELRRRLVATNESFSFTFRVGYTLAKLIDDGIVNTSDALVPGNFRAERARSLLDRRHRFVFAGVFNLPRLLGSVQLSPILRLASGAPFNLSIGGTDRNLDDVGNDRPNFSGDLKSLRWHGPESSIDPAIVQSFSLPMIGQTGNLPRNAGTGPGLFLFDLNVTREFRFGERLRIRPMIELDNVLNKTVFSFGAEFINFNALSPTATPEQRQAFYDTFLLATRTLRPRQLRVGLRIDF